MKVRDVISALETRGAAKVRTKGSHRQYESACGRCHTTVSGHPSDDVGKGLAKKIQRDMEPCYGPRWLDA